MIMHDQVRIQVLHAITWLSQEKLAEDIQEPYQALTPSMKNPMEAENSLTQCNVDYLCEIIFDCSHPK